MAYESSTVGSFTPALPQMPMNDEVGYIEDVSDDGTSSLVPGWWVVPCVLCGGTMIASAVLLL